MDAATLVTWIGPCAAVTVFAVMLSSGAAARAQPNHICAAAAYGACGGTVRRGCARADPGGCRGEAVRTARRCRGRHRTHVDLTGCAGRTATSDTSGRRPPVCPDAAPCHRDVRRRHGPVSVMVMAWIFSVRFAISPLDVARQVFFAQLLPLGDRRSLARVAAGHRDVARAAVCQSSNLMLLALIVLCLVVLGPRLVAIGWAPFVAGVGLTLCALFAGTMFAGRDASVRPAAAVAAAMRNPVSRFLSPRAMPPRPT